MDKQNDKKEKPTSYTGNLRIIIVLLMVIIILLLFRSCGSLSEIDDIADIPKGVAAFFSTERDKNAKDGEIPTKSPEEIQSELNAKLEDGMMNITMNPSPVFADGESEGDLRIENKAMNHYPQVVEIFRDDTGEMLYQSGAIPVGSNLEKAKLSVDLEAGEYNCTAYFNAIDQKTGALIGKAGAKIKITVKA